MNETAYLMLIIDVDLDNPTVLGCRITNDDNPGVLGRNLRWALAAKGWGNNFESARKDLISRICNEAGYTWICRLTGWENEARPLTNV